MVAKKSSQPALFDAVSFPPDPLPWEVAAENDRLVARLVFNRPVDTPFDYLVPDGLRTLIAPGSASKHRSAKGDRPPSATASALAATSEQKRLKTIDSILDRRPLVSESMLRLTRWIADYYLCSWGQVLESVVPAGVKQQAGTRLVTSFVCADATGRRRTGSQAVGQAKSSAGGVGDRWTSDGCGRADASGRMRHGATGRVATKRPDSRRSTSPDAGPPDGTAVARSRSGSSTPINNGRSRRFWVCSAPASTARFCCTASPAAARPKFIFRRFAKSSVTVARRSCWCRRSASRRRRSAGFAAALPQSPCCTAI